MTNAMNCSVVLIDELCDAFERKWYNGLRPELEPYLDQIDATDRESLLRELLPIDLHYRTHQCNETPELSDYVARLPEFAKTIEEVFQSAGPTEFACEPVQYFQFAHLRKAVEDGFITDCQAERILRSTPISAPLIDAALVSTATGSPDITKIFSAGPESLRDDLAEGTLDSPESTVTLRLELVDSAALIDQARTEFTGLPIRYQLIKQIGKGGMGTVFHAFDSQLRRAVAIKILAIHDPTIALSMQREWEVLARMNHPGIVSIYDSGHLADGRPYLVMEYVEGANLDASAKKVSRSTSEIVRLISTCARSLEIVHYLGIVHRDLKPSNILVFDGSPKLVDFGLARFVDSLSGDRSGTLPYASPEQLSGHPTDQRSDVYSIGVLLFELLTKSLPVPVTSEMTLDDVIRAKECPPSVYAAGIPRPLAAIIAKCLAANPKERYLSAGALAHDLDQFQSLRPVSAMKHLSPGYWVQMAFAPGTGVLLGLTTVIVAVVLATIGGFPTLTLWAVFGVLAGLEGGRLLMREAQRPKHTVFAKTAFYSAGFVLLFEAILVIAELARR